MNKKLQITAAVLLIIIISVFFFGSKKYQNTNNPPNSESQTASQNVKLTIDNGSETINYSTNYSDNLTAFDLLKKASDDTNFKIDYEQYDFGVFIKSINGTENSQVKAWIYFVNGNSAYEGADMHKLQPGDSVEWKYIKPME